MSEDQLPECDSKTPISDLVNPMITTGQDLKLSLVPKISDDCYCYWNPPVNCGGGIRVSVVIITVDGKSMDGQCNSSYSICQDPNESYTGNTIKVTETTNHFFCEFPIGE